MTEIARKQRRRQQARRRRAAALLVVASLVLLLVAALATQVPAETTTSSTSLDPAASAEGATTGEPATEPCPEGEVEAGAEGQAEAGAEAECEAPVGEPEEPPAAEPPEEPEPAPEPTAVPTAGSGPAPEPAATEAQQPQQQDSVGEPRRRLRAVRRSSLAVPQGGAEQQGAGGTASPGSSSSGHGTGHGAEHSGGTAARTGAVQPHRWAWSGAWAIPWQIVACESGGSYGALNASSGAGGAYQILPSTWKAYGGAGEPQSAPPAEQDRIAAEIWADSGPAAWVCAQDGNWAGASLGAGLAGSLGPLPDPLPPARRLDPGFVALLTRTARAQQVDWALLLAAARLRGGGGQVPASAAELRRIAARLAAAGDGPLRARARRLFARRPPALRLVALTYYDRAIGRRGLMLGLEAVRARLAKRVLASRRLKIYPGGRVDIAAGRVDVRVLTVLLYLAQRYRSVTVTSLISGHSFYTSAGRPSLHAFGRAVDVAALNGTPIFDHQQPGGLTERALRLVLLLPREMQPSELISLFDLGGPSFAAADHADHIHVGF